jgi:hypothetical protein
MGTAVGKRMCPMIDHRCIWLTTMAAGVLVAGLSATAHARGGGGGHVGAHSASGPAMRGPASLRDPAPSAALPRAPASVSGPPAALARQNAATAAPSAARDPAPSAALPRAPASVSGEPAAIARQNSLAATSEALTGPTGSAVTSPAGTAMTPPGVAPPLPPSAIGTPETQVPPVAPLSPTPDLITESSGGASGVDLSATSPTPTSSGPSPSESAPSHPGGGGETLADCMSFWDRGTHMSKTEWRTACVRTLNRLDLKP